MKKVFSNSDETIHIFAQQSQSEGRSSNVFFDGTKIYSYGYHYLLGEFIDKETILINDEGYSSTTSKHILSLKAGTKQYRQFYKTNIDLKIVYSNVQYLVNKLSKANKKELYTVPILSHYKNLNKYLEYTKTKTKISKTKEYKYIKKIALSIEKDTQALLEALKLRQIKEAKNQAIKQSENIAKFRNHKTDRVRSKLDYLRLSFDKTHLETSQGVKIEIKEAKILNNLISKGKDIKGFKLGYYTVIGLANNILKVGCHNIELKEINLISKYL
jgi:glutaredoxin-related protein